MHANARLRNSLNAAAFASGLSGAVGVAGVSPGNPKDKSISVAGGFGLVIIGFLGAAPEVTRLGLGPRFEV